MRIVFSSVGLSGTTVIAAERTGRVCYGFPPVTDVGLHKDSATSESLADFQLYAARVREPLKKAGIEFHEVYAHSFRTRVGKTVSVFRPVKGDTGYYLIVSGKKPRIEYGVMTDVDLLQAANEYFR